MQLLSIDIKDEQGVLYNQLQTRQISSYLGFKLREQAELVTAVSEIVINAVSYANSAHVKFSIEDGDPQSLMVTILDNGPGIANVNDYLLDANQISLESGLIRAKRLVDSFSINSTAHGTSVILSKRIPRHFGTASETTLATVYQTIDTDKKSYLQDIQQQNIVMLNASIDLYHRQNEVEKLNLELEETNRGVVALYIELDEKAAALKQVSETKTRFLSHMTHELRTPLNSIVMLSRLLLDGTDGDLTEQQKKPVSLVQNSAESLLELVNDALDLAKIEAGKVEVKIVEMDVELLFGTLRGMFRPLVLDRPVDLQFITSSSLPLLRTDEGKVAQILRNFISNALKFTHRGIVTVRAEVIETNIIFSVEDTGIGIAEKDHNRLFQEYSQVGTDQSSKGTGLGLSLSKRLADILGGSVSMKSELGKGSIFSASIPIYYQSSAGLQAAESITREFSNV